MHRLGGIGFAVYEMASNRRYAEDYLLRFKHPFFRRFSKELAEGWKVAFLQDRLKASHEEVTLELQGYRTTSAVIPWRTSSR